MDQTAIDLTDAPQAREGDEVVLIGRQDGEEISADELAEWAVRQPEKFSPNVTLRAVVQDYLLPTIAYYGGAAEIAYFAQTAEVYRVLERPPTPILPRASMTIVEKHTGRSL